MKLNFKKYLLKFWPLILIFAIWFVFSSPYLVKGKVPFPSTYLVNFFSPWNAYPGFSSPVKNNAMPDVISQIYPWKTLTIESLKNHQIPLWNPYSFSGSPLLANYQSAVLSPFNLLFMVLPFIDAWSLLILLQPLLAGVFMYLYLKSLKIRDEGVTLGSIAFMFCGFLTTWMAYGTLGYAILFLPLSLYTMEKYFQTKKSRFLILLALTFPLSFFSGHFQISIYFLLFNLFYIVYKFIVNRNIKDFLLVIFYSALGIVLSLPQLLPSIELYTQSLRSGIFQKIEVIPWGYFSTFVAPDFLGNPVTRNDWFGHYAEWNSYIGLIPLMLGVYAVFIKRKKQIIFFSLMAILALALSFSTPLLDLLVALKIPVLSTSAASRIIVLFSFSMSVLAAFGFQSFIEDLDNKRKKEIVSLITSFAVIFTILWLVVLLKLFIPVDKIVIAKQNIILPSVIFASFAALSLIILFFSKRIKNKNVVLVVSLIFILITLFDMFRFANKWMPFDSRNLVYPQIPVAKEFAKISGYNRVISNMGSEATNYYGLSSLEGYDALYLKRYGEFMASLNTGKLEESPRSVVLFPKNGRYSKQALDFMGVKYLVYKVGDGHSSWTYPFWTYKDGDFNLKYNDGTYQILENKNAFPRTYLVNKFVVEDNSQKILDKMFDKDFNLKESIVLEKDPGLSLDKDTFGSSEIVKYSGNQITINTSSNGNSMLFLSDVFYPGWKAKIDGTKTEIYRADYTFRAIYLPKGKHTVEFIYKPASYKMGVKLAILAILIIPVIEVATRKKKVISKT